MVLETIFNIIKVTLEFIFGALPTISIELPAGFLEWFQNIVSASAYFLPLTDLLLMFGIWMVVTNFQIVWKVIQRVWDALPFT